MEHVVIVIVMPEPRMPCEPRPVYVGPHPSVFFFNFFLQMLLALGAYCAGYLLPTCPLSVAVFVCNMAQAESLPP